MTDYGTRLRYEMVAKFLNDHDVMIDLDGDLYLGDAPSMYLDRRGDDPNAWEINDGAPIITQKQSDDRTWS